MSCDEADIIDTQPPIFLITGVPGAGKTSVAAALMQRFPRGLHIPVDDLREWVVSGIAHPLPAWTDETERQFRLARQAAAQTARLYADAGFAVAIDDVIYPPAAQALIAAHFAGYRVGKVLLQPDVNVVLARNTRRTTKDVDTSTSLAEFIPAIHRALTEANFADAGWLVVDSTNLNLDQTVDQILEHVIHTVG